MRNYQTMLVSSADDMHRINLEDEVAEEKSRELRCQKKKTTRYKYRAMRDCRRDLF